MKTNKNLNGDFEDDYNFILNNEIIEIKKFNKGNK